MTMRQKSPREFNYVDRSSVDSEFTIDVLPFYIYQFKVLAKSSDAKPTESIFRNMQKCNRFDDKSLSNCTSNVIK